MKHYILDGHEPVKVDGNITWARWFEAADRHVADEKIGDVRISTVFLGIDHQYGDGPPLLFETMIFGGKYDDEEHEYQERYATWQEAEKGHADAVALVKAGHVP